MEKLRILAELNPLDAALFVVALIAVIAFGCMAVIRIGMVVLTDELDVR